MERSGRCALARLALLGVAIVAACTPPVVESPAGSPQSPGITAAPTGADASSSGASVTVSTALLALRLPRAVSRAVAFADGASALLAGGLAGSGTVATILRVTLPDGPIATIGQLPAAVHDAGGADLGAAPLVLGGGRVVPESIVQSLSASIGQLPQPRADLAAVDVNGEVIVVGGGTPARLDRAVLATSDGRQFTQIATLVVGVRYPAVAVEGGVIVVVGGTDGASDRMEIQLIDPVTGTVQLIGRLPHGLSHASAFVLEDHLLVAGGRTAGKAQDAIWSIDPTTGVSAVVGHLPQTLSDAAAVVIGDSAYLLGGEAVDPLATIIAIRLE